MSPQHPAPGAEMDRAILLARLACIALIAREHCFHRPGCACWRRVLALTVWP